MSHYSRLGQYMDPNVFRSTSHSVYHVGSDLASPRYVTTDAFRSLRHADYLRDPQDRHYESPQVMRNFHSDRRYTDQYNSSSRDIDNLVRKYAISRQVKTCTSS